MLAVICSTAAATVLTLPDISAVEAAMVVILSDICSAAVATVADWAVVCSAAPANWVAVEDSSVAELAKAVVLPVIWATIRPRLAAMSSAAWANWPISSLLRTSIFRVKSPRAISRNTATAAVSGIVIFRAKTMASPPNRTIRAALHTSSKRSRLSTSATTALATSWQSSS